MSENHSEMIEYAKTFLGLPYKWGGNHPTTGLDCSGLVCEVLRAFGLIKGDHTAQQIYDTLTSSNSFRTQVSPGSILFFGKSTRELSHVAIAINTQIMIEAGGGDHTVIDRNSAIQKNAFVRIRPIASRLDLVAALNLVR